MAFAAEVRPSRTAGDEWVTITSSLQSDMTAAGHRCPTVIPCRDPTSGIRHTLHLVTQRLCSSARPECQRRGITAGFPKQNRSMGSRVALNGILENQIFGR